jgi:hypothetical protein
MQNTFVDVVLFISMPNKNDQHIKECSKNDPVVYRPPKKNYVEFENAHNVPYTIYADFESII